MRVQPWFLAPLVLALTVIVPRSVHAQNYDIHILHTFEGSNGTLPTATPIRDAEGNLYGTTAAGGDLSCPNTPGTGCGVVYKIDKNRNYTVLYAFMGGSSDGANPESGVIRDKAGNLFGTTESLNGSGSTLFEIKKNHEEKILKYFNNFTDGAIANSAPTLDSKGNLFGNTQYGGDPNCGFNGDGCGVIYEFAADGKFHLLYTFKSLKQGIQAWGTPILNSKGDLFGITVWGGDLNCEHTVGCGTIFELEHTGKYKVLHKFTGKSDGSYPACLTADSHGNTFGVTSAGGDLGCGYNGCGTTFLLNQTGKLKTLYEFTPFTENNNAHSCPVLDLQGNLYGTNSNGGPHNSGYLYELSTAGKFTVLYNFPIANSSQGGVPLGVLRTANGDFYGVNGLGGDTQCGVENSGCGTAFKLTP